eukprot:5638337-Pyramimonas_sp.AAC.1
MSQYCYRVMEYMAVESAWEVPGLLPKSRKRGAPVQLVIQEYLSWSSRTATCVACAVAKVLKDKRSGLTLSQPHVRRRSWDESGVGPRSTSSARQTSPPGSLRRSLMRCWELTVFRVKGRQWWMR